MTKKKTLLTTTGGENILAGGSHRYRGKEKNLKEERSWGIPDTWKNRSLIVGKLSAFSRIVTPVAVQERRRTTNSLGAKAKFLSNRDSGI